MTALEKIKKLELIKERGDWPIEHRDGIFLLKAFKVMKEVAEHLSVNPTSLDLPMGRIITDKDWEKVENKIVRCVSKEFEKRMKK